MFLSVEPSAELLKLPNPYDPTQNAKYALHDASLFHGKYYLYFGVAPALIAFVPYKAVTGRDLSQQTAGMLFCYTGFLAGALVIGQVRRDFLPEVPGWALFFTTILWGLIDWAPVLLRRMAVWEVAISSSFAWMMMGILCLYCRQFRSKRIAWTALASVSFGLMFASRPSTLFSAGCVFIPVAVECWRDRKVDWNEFLKAAVPLCVIVAAVLAYNYARFGNGLDFGVRYVLAQLDLSRRQAFSWQNASFNTYMFIWAPARLSAFFPFFKLAAIPQVPEGHDGIENGVEEMNGALPNMPVLFLAFLAISAAALSSPERRHSFRIWVALNIWIFLGVLSVLVSFVSICSRYLSDFVPPIALLAAIGCMAAARWKFPFSQTAKVAVALIGLYSGAAVLCQSFEFKHIFRISSPQEYAGLSHFLNYPSYWYDRLRGRHYGPVEITVMFPENSSQNYEPLLSTGSGRWVDTVFVRYEGNHHIRIALAKFNHIYALSDSVEADFHNAHKIRIDMASLYPPPDHPYYDRFSPEARKRMGLSVSITVDGTPMLTMDAPIEFDDPIGYFPAIGFTRAWREEGLHFSGHILSTVRINDR